MAVVNLPQDTRFGDLGKGLGGLVGAIAQGVQTQQAQQGVAEIMQDQTMSEPQKYAKILKDHGTVGQELYTKAVQNQYVQAKIKDTLSQVGLQTVQTEAARAKLEKEFPLHLQQIQAGTANVQSETAARDTKLAPEVAQIQANTGLTQANTGNVQSEEATRRAILPGTLAAQPIARDVQAAQAANINSEVDERNALLGGRVAAQPVARDLTAAQAEHQRVESGLGAASLPEVIAKGEVAKLQVQQLKGALDATGVGAGLDKTLTDSGIDPTSPHGQMAKSAYMMEPDIKKKGEAFMKVLVAGKPSEPAVRKETAASVESAHSMKRFLEAFTHGGAEKIGNLDKLFNFETPGAVKAYLEEKGYSTGDTEFVQMLNSSLQQTASAATSGGGFFAEGRVHLAERTTGNIKGSPLHAVIAIDEAVGRKLDSLANQRLAASGLEQTKNIDDAISHYKEIKAVTSTLNSTPAKEYTLTTNGPDGTPRRSTEYLTQPPQVGMKIGERTVVDATPGTNDKNITYFNGDLINTKSFAKIIDHEKTYANGQVTGGELIARSRAAGRDPESVLRDVTEWQKRHGVAR
jgi:hypothetical protein